MSLENKKSHIGKLLLLITTLIWGSSFFILKNTLENLPTFFVLAVRFSIAIVFLGVIFFKKVISIGKSTLIKGVLAGATLGVAFIFQTIGLKHTTPSKNAFLTATYCIIVPFMMWIFYKKKPNVYNILAAVLCVCGIGLISLDGHFNIKLGDGLTLIGSIFFALQIILLCDYAKTEDNVKLLLVELFTATIMFWIISLCSETKYYPTTFSFSVWLPVLYLAIFSTVFAQMAQIVGQKLIPPSEAGLILSLEAVFGVMFSIIFYKEKMTTVLYIGFALVFVGLVASETKLEFLKKSFWKKRTLKAATSDNIVIDEQADENIEKDTLKTTTSDNIVIDEQADEKTEKETLQAATSDNIVIDEQADEKIEKENIANGDK